MGYHVPGFEYPSPHGYHDWKTTCAELERLGLDCAGTEYTSIGHTCQKREIPALKIGMGVAGRKTVIVVGCHHAREWISVEVPLAFATKIACRKFGPLEDALLQEYAFVLVPMLNPDGHSYSTSPETRLWRKNMSVGEGIGVDLNRNYAIHWNEGFRSCDPNSDMFTGVRQFSELETCAFRDLVRSIRPDIVLSYHAFGEKVLHPWAFEPFSSTDPALLAAREIAEAYVSGTGRKGNPYTLCLARDHYGPGIAVGGDMGDWVLQETGGACLPVSVELSPMAADPGFVLPSCAIPDVVMQNWDGLMELLGAYRSMSPRFK